MRNYFTAGLVAIVAAIAASPAIAQVPERAVISVNGIYQSGTSAVDSTVAFTVNAETATFTSKFPAKTGPGFDGGIRVGIRGPIGFALAATHFQTSGTADITGKIPHPFFFNQPRDIAGTANLKREETTTRFALTLSSAPGKKLQFTAFAGPAFFSLKQDLVDTVTYTDAYPYDTATFGQSTTRQVTKTKVGFAGGADATFFFSKSVGIGVTAMIVKATIPLTASDGSSVTVNAGGTQVGGGLRFRF